MGSKGVFQIAMDSIIGIVHLAQILSEKNGAEKSSIREKWNVCVCVWRDREMDGWMDI